MALEFIEDIHAYSFDSKPVPSVTQVLQAAGVVDYSYMPAPVREHALKRGRKVHLATHFDDEGDLNDTTLSEEILPYVQAWRLFRAQTGFTPELIEHRGYNEHYRFAGCLDRTGWLDGRRVMVDIKTNSAEPWVAVQLAAYSSFFDDPRTYQRICVKLHDDGTYSLPFGEMLHSRFWFEQFNDFICCLGAFHARRKYSRLAEAIAA